MRAFVSNPLTERQFGVLLHLTSLPGRHGIGDLGENARHFVNWLSACGARLWQILPLNAPGGSAHIHPYSSWSALAGNPQLISLDDLHHDGLLTGAEIDSRSFPEGWLEPTEVLPWKMENLYRATDRLCRGHQLTAEFKSFCEQAVWAQETATFAALHQHQGAKPWWQWQPELRDRDEKTLSSVGSELQSLIDRHIALQFLFERQWTALRHYANARGVRILSDIPIYVRADSADVWTHREGWRIGPDGSLPAVTGCPPDEFTKDGQWWGGPLYNWEQMADTDFAWWRSRINRALEHADAVRIDHFRALAAHWEIPANAATAREGRWVEGPGLNFFERLRAGLGPLPLCVEDLGVIDDAVIALRDALGLPGMRILHYGFGEAADNPHLPHNHPRNALVYPGNHDNNTTLGWWKALDPRARAHVQHYLGRHGDDIVWDLNRAVLASPANVAIIAMQDLLALDSWARMNDSASYTLPTEGRRNWCWRLLPDQASGEIASRLRFLATQYGRVA